MQLGSGIPVAVSGLAATTPIWPLAWELPYAVGAALKIKKKKVLNEYTNCDGAMELLELSNAAHGNLKLVHPFGKLFGSFTVKYA